MTNNIYPAFVLHNSSCTDRSEIVNELVKKTKATVFQSYLLPDKKKGCCASHIGALKLSRSLHPLKHTLIFEDDCVLEEGWEEALKGLEFADVVYLGYNDKCEHTVFGTHALLLSPKARDVIIEHTMDIRNELPSISDGAYDWVLSKLCRKYGLITCLPKLEDKEKWCHQQKGLMSIITGKVRV